jgi:hypothetical protein
VCRSSRGECDVEDACDGFSIACPADEVAPAGTSCGDDGNLCTDDLCGSNGSGTQCSDGSVCNGDETCNGEGTCQPGITLDCNDGDACTHDVCDPIEGCRNPVEPATGCVDRWATASLLVDEGVVGRERLQVRMLRGPALMGTSFGDPLPAGGTAYSVCVYDDAGGLAGRLEVDRAGSTCGLRSCWKRIGPRGFAFRDRSASSDGTKGMKLLGGGVGRSTLAFRAGNDSRKGLTSMPTGIAAALAGSTSATVQVHGSDAPDCFSATLGEVVKDTGSIFKAR